MARRSGAWADWGATRRDEATPMPAELVVEADGFEEGYDLGWNAGRDYRDHAIDAERSQAFRAGLTSGLLLVASLALLWVWFVG